MKVSLGEIWRKHTFERGGRGVEIFRKHTVNFHQSEQLGPKRLLFSLNTIILTLASVWWYLVGPSPQGHVFTLHDRSIFLAIFGDKSSKVKWVELQPAVLLPVPHTHNIYFPIEHSYTFVLGKTKTIRSINVQKQKKLRIKNYIFFWKRRYCNKSFGVLMLFRFLADFRWKFAIKINMRSA